MITEKEWSGRLAFSIGERHLRKLSALADEAAQIAAELLETEIATRKHTPTEGVAAGQTAENSDAPSDETSAYEKGWKNAHAESLAPAWTIDCSDGTKIKTSNVEDVLGFENAPGRSANGLELRAGSPTFFQFKISLGNEEDDNFRYSAVGPDQRVLYFSKKVDEFRDSIKSGYHILYQQSDFTVGAILGAVIFPFLPTTEISNSGQDMWGDIFGAVLAGAFLGAVVFGASLLILKKLLFPVALFTINSGEKREKLYANLRGVLLGVIATVGGGLFATYLADRFFQ